MEICKEGKIAKKLDIYSFLCYAIYNRRCVIMFDKIEAKMKKSPFLKSLWNITYANVLSLIFLFRLCHLI